LLSVALVRSENGGRVLPAILLCGVRTFLFSHKRKAIRWPAEQS
jgi:hypothetical protein